MSDAIVIRGLTKTFGTKTAVRDLDLVVPRGSLCGFIGPNGAGKTTTLRMLMSILFPDSGELSVLGKRSALESKDRIGYLPEERGVYRKMKVGAFLNYIARIKGVRDRSLDARVRGWLDSVQLAEVYGKRCEELSKGMQQKVQFLAAVIHEPELIILDEPFSGLDPLNMRLLRELIRELHRRGATLLFSTHVMQQAEQLCDRVLMIHEGRKVLDSTVGEIRRRFDPHALLVEPADSTASPDVLRGLAGVRSVDAAGGTWAVTLDGETPPQVAIERVVTALPVVRVELQRPTLEDVFVRIVEQRDPAAAPTLRHALCEEPAVTDGVA